MSYTHRVVGPNPARRTRKIFDTKIYVQQKITHFTDLEVWKQAHELTILIYFVTKSFPKEEIYGLTSQIKRAAVSIESCIAEGFSRYHYKDRLNFYYGARGSIAEVQTQIRIALDVKFLDKISYEKVVEQTKQITMLLNGLIKATNQRAKSS